MILYFLSFISSVAAIRNGFPLGWMFFDSEEIVDTLSIFDLFVLSQLLGIVLRWVGSNVSRGISAVF